MMDFKFLNPLKDKKLVDESLFLYQTDNVPQQKCVIDCAASPKCGSVNHHDKTQTCILNREPNSNGEDVKDFLTNAEGWIFFQKTKTKDSPKIPEGDVINKNEEFYTERGKIIQEMDVLPLQWKLSFKFKPRVMGYEKISSLIHFQSKKISGGSKANIIAAGVSKNQHLYVKLITATNFTAFYTYSKEPLQPEQWIYVRINLYQLNNGKYYIFWAIDNQLQNDVEVPGWGTVYTDIQVLVTAKGSNVVSGKMKELKFQPSKGITYNSGLLQEIIPKWGKSWLIKVSFKVVKQPIEKWNCIFHFVKDGGYFNRLPTMYFKSDTNEVQFVLCQDPTNRNLCLNTFLPSFVLNTKYDFEIKHQLEGNGYYMSVYINGVLEKRDVTFTNPGVYENVEVYIGPWFWWDQHTNWSVEVSNLMFANIN
ncbi:uncharacterized protein [Clytia hemisphaerica]